MSEPSDDQLLEAWRQGQRAAFDQLFTRHYQQVYAVVYHTLGQREDAEDVAQETFLTLYHRPPPAGPPLIAWLCRVAINRGYNLLRGAQREQRRVEHVAGDSVSPDPYDAAVQAEERSQVRAILAELPERQAQVLLLRHAGLSYRDIAQVLEVAPGSVGVLLARGERAFASRYRATTVFASEGSGPNE